MTQLRALFDAFLARFFENEMSQGSRDMKTSFLRLIGMLAVPGFLIPVANLGRWARLSGLPEAEFRLAIITDKALYMTMSMAAMMLLAAIVWPALLADRRDAIVLGSFPVRVRTIVAAKIGALLCYLGIVAGGMHVIASYMYGMALGGGTAGALRAVPAHFIASTLACMFACLLIAAFQALVLAAGGARLLARLTAPAQLLLAATGILLFLFSPFVAAVAMDFTRASARSAWVEWLPVMWFVGLYEVIVGRAEPVMPAMAARAAVGFAAAAGILALAYPVAYARVARDAMAGTPLGRRASIASRLLRVVVTRIPVTAAERGSIAFLLLTLGRVARNKLIVASAVGAALAMTLPFLLRWWAQSWIPAAPGRSHIAVPFVFVMFTLAGMRMAYNVPAEPGAAWLFATALRPGRLGITAARTTGLMLGVIPPSFIALAIYWWFFGLWMALSLAVTLFAFGCCILELSLRSLDFVPFTRAYNPERGQIQARWPLYLFGLVLCLEWLPTGIGALLASGNYWLGPLALLALAAALRKAVRIEPPDLVDADFEDRPLALRLY